MTQPHTHRLACSNIFFKLYFMLQICLSSLLIQNRSCHNQPPTMHVSTLTLPLPDLTYYTTQARPLVVEDRRSHDVQSRKPHDSLHHAATTQTGAYQLAANTTSVFQQHEQNYYQHQDAQRYQVSLSTLSPSYLHTLTRRFWLADGRTRKNAPYTAYRQEHCSPLGWSTTYKHPRKHCKTKTKYYQSQLQPRQYRFTWKTSTRCPLSAHNHIRRAHLRTGWRTAHTRPTNHCKTNTKYYQSQPQPRQYRLIWKTSIRCLWSAYNHIRRIHLLPTCRQEPCSTKHVWIAKATHSKKPHKTKTKTHSHHIHLHWNALTHCCITDGHIWIAYHHIAYRLERPSLTYGWGFETTHPSTRRKTKTKMDIHHCQPQPNPPQPKQKILHRRPRLTVDSIQRAAPHTERSLERCFPNYYCCSPSIHPSKHQHTKPNTNAHHSQPQTSTNQPARKTESQPRKTPGDNRGMITSEDGHQKTVMFSKKTQMYNVDPLYTQQIHQEGLRAPLERGGRPHRNPNHHLTPPPNKIPNRIHRTHAAKIRNAISTSQFSSSKHQSTTRKWCPI